MHALAARPASVRPSRAPPPGTQRASAAYTGARSCVRVGVPSVRATARALDAVRAAFSLHSTRRWLRDAP